MRDYLMGSQITVRFTDNQQVRKYARKVHWLPIAMDDGVKTSKSEKLHRFENILLSHAERFVCCALTMRYMVYSLYI